METVILHKKDLTPLYSSNTSLIKVLSIIQSYGKSAVIIVFVLEKILVVLKNFEGNLKKQDKETLKRKLKKISEKEGIKALQELENSPEKLEELKDSNFRRYTVSVVKSLFVFLKQIVSEGLILILALIILDVIIELMKKYLKYKDKSL